MSNADEVRDAVSELLWSIGWRNSCDAQSSNLRDALPKIKALLEKLP